jgi:hypothetical protein
MRSINFLSVLFVTLSAAISGCVSQDIYAPLDAKSALGRSILPLTETVSENIADPCRNATGDKYFIDPNRVGVVSSVQQGSQTLVIMKADTRDALCTLNKKNKVVSIVDTSPKSADQVLAEEEKAKQTKSDDKKPKKEKTKKK